MAEDKWSQKGILFKIPTLDDFEQVKNYIYSDFFPEEPIFRGLKLFEGNGILVSLLRKMIEKLMIKEGLKHATSMVAIDDSGEIVGCRYVCHFQIKRTLRFGKTHCFEVNTTIIMTANKTMSLTKISKFF